MVTDLQGKAAIVTGGGSGIGRAVCLELAARGARVAVFDITERAAAVAGEVTALGTEAVACRVDVSSSGSVRRAVSEALAGFGAIDILVNCAGLYQVGTIDQVGEADWDRVLAVNLKGAFLMCKEVALLMKRQGSGAIVNVSSISGRTKSQLAAVNYVASKAGVIGLTMCLANQLAPWGIRVNCVAPGTVDTPMVAGLGAEEREQMEKRTPLGRLGRAEEVAAAIAFLASSAASYITGETINVNGGAFMI